MEAQMKEMDKVEIEALFKHEVHSDEEKDEYDYQLFDDMTNKKNKDAQYDNKTQSGSFQIPRVRSGLFDQSIEYVAKKFQHGSLKGSIFNLTTATIGAGVLSVPRSFYYSGVVLSIAVYFICAVLGYISNFLLVKTAEKLKKYSYMDLAHSTCPKLMVIFIKLNFLIANFGYIVAYIILVNKTFAHSLSIFFGDSIPYYLIDVSNGRFWAPLIITFIVFPLSLFRTLGALRFVALMSVSISFFIVIVIFIEPFTMRFGSLEDKYSSLIMYRPEGIFVTFSTALFSFTCQNNTLDIYKELQNPIRRRIKKVIFRVMSICFIFYTMAGISGYLTFADATSNLLDEKYGGIVLLADYHKYFEVILSLLLIGFSITFALPFNIKPCKDCLLDLINPGLKRDSNTSHLILVFSIAMSSLISALYIPMMSDVITLMGAISSPLICFVFPSIFYLRTYPNTGLMEKVLLVGFFILFMIMYAFYGVVDFYYNISETMVHH